MMVALHGLMYAHIPMALWWIVGPVLVWRVGLRFYRLMARQKFSRLRYWWRAASLGALTGFIGVVAYEQAAAFLSLCAGLAVGSVFGLVSLRRTSLDVQADGRTTVTPDPVVGVLLSLLLTGRILWRVVAGSTNDVGGWTLAEFVRNPSTMALFGLFSAHYLVYALGILRAVWRARRV